MDFWTPTQGQWSEGFTDKDMPYYAKYNYVKIETYNEKTGKFEFYARDNFDGELDEDFWQVSNGWGSGSHTSSIYYKSQVYTEYGNLVFKMEPDPYWEGSIEQPAADQPIEEIEEINDNGEPETGVIQKLIKFFTN